MPRRAAQKICQREMMIIKNLTPPRCIQCLMPQFTWRVADACGELFLTFDDGPTPGVTEWVLDELRRVGAKATFFCIGHNAERFPGLLARIVAEGHAVGNHTYSHLSGYGCSVERYVGDVALAAEVLGPTKLFRPPYGRITPRELRALRGLGFEVVLWSRLSMDYSARVSPSETFRFSTEDIRDGDVLAFHDSYRAEVRLRFALPRALQLLKERGFRFSTLREQRCARALLRDEADVSVSPLRWARGGLARSATLKER